MHFKQIYVYMLLYNICCICKYSYYFAKNAPNPLVFIEIVIMTANSIDLYHASRPVHLIFIMEYVRYILKLFYALKLS